MIKIKQWHLTVLLAMGQIHIVHHKDRVKSLAVFTPNIIMHLGKIQTQIKWQRSDDEGVCLCTLLFHLSLSLYVFLENKNTHDVWHIQNIQYRLLYMVFEKCPGFMDKAYVHDRKAEWVQMRAYFHWLRGRQLSRRPSRPLLAGQSTLIITCRFFF